MTNTIDAASESDSFGPIATSGSLSRSTAGWGLFVVAYLAFAVVTIATVQSGTHGDARIANPTPGPAPYPPFLGFDNWPLVVALSSIPMAISLIGSLVWRGSRSNNAGCTGQGCTS